MSNSSIPGEPGQSGTVAPRAKQTVKPSQTAQHETKSPGGSDFGRVMRPLTALFVAHKSLPDPPAKLTPKERRTIFADRLKRVDLDVMRVLLGFRIQVRHSAWTSKRVVADRVGASVRTVQVAFRRLELHGFVRQARLANGVDLDDERNRTNWRFYFPTLVPEGFQVPSDAPDRRPPAIRKVWHRLPEGEAFSCLPPPSLFETSVASQENAPVVSEPSAPIASNPFGLSRTERGQDDDDSEGKRLPADAREREGASSSSFDEVLDKEPKAAESTRQPDLQTPAPSSSSPGSSGSTGQEPPRKATRSEIVAVVTRAQEIFPHEPDLHLKVRNLAKDSRLSQVALALDHAESHKARSWGYVVTTLKNRMDEGGALGPVPAKRSTGTNVPTANVAPPLPEQTPEQVAAEIEQAREWASGRHGPALAKFGTLMLAKAGVT